MCFASNLIETDGPQWTLGLWRAGVMMHQYREEVPLTPSHPCCQPRAAADNSSLIVQHMSPSVYSLLLKYHLSDFCCMWPEDPTTSLWKGTKHINAQKPQNNCKLLDDDRRRWTRCCMVAFPYSEPFRQKEQKCVQLLNKINKVRKWG